MYILPLLFIGSSALCESLLKSSTVLGSPFVSLYSLGSVPPLCLLWCSFRGNWAQGPQSEAHSTDRQEWGVRWVLVLREGVGGGGSETEYTHADTHLIHMHERAHLYEYMHSPTCSLQTISYQWITLLSTTTSLPAADASMTKMPLW